MGGDPGEFCCEAQDAKRETGLVAFPAQPRRYLFPVLTLASLVGLITAAAAVISADVVGSGVDVAASDAGNWRVSALLIAAIAAAWFAGATYLALTVLRSARDSSHLQIGIPGWLVAFAIGPLMLALFLLTISLAQGPENRLAAFVVPGTVLLVMIFGQRRYHLMAERLLVSLFIWIAILIVPTFWRDAVNLQMSEFLFGLLNRLGLLG